MSWNNPAYNVDNMYLLYKNVINVFQGISIDTILNNIVPLLAKGETSINQELADLATIDPGQLDQSRLMKAQMDMSRWQLAAQLISNFCSGIASGLKSTVQNIGR